MGIYVYAEGFFAKPIDDEIKSRIIGLSYAKDCTVEFTQLRYLNVRYVNFQGITCVGEIICNKDIAQDLLEIFCALFDAAYQIDKIRLVDEYGADDTKSCLDDNTSCFNFRLVEGSANLSKHALGMAIDINPVYNPYITFPGGQRHVSPQGSDAYADRDADFAHKLGKDDLCYELFMAHGFKWGGDWHNPIDYQHFYK